MPVGPASLVMSLVLASANAPAPDAGARLTPASPRPISLEVAPSFFDEHASMVRHDLLLFHDSLLGINPSLANPRAKEETPKLSFVQAPKADDLLEVARSRDRLQLFRERRPAGASLSLGLALFAASTIASAHAPPPIRFLFDRSVHLGPAIFDAGGMGAGIGGMLPN